MLSTKVNPIKHVATNDNIKQLVNDEIKRLGLEADLQFIDTSEVTDMSGLFANTCFCGDISKWDVSKVEDMTGMFRNCRGCLAVVLLMRKTSPKILGWKVQAARHRLKFSIVKNRLLIVK